MILKTFCNSHIVLILELQFRHNSNEYLFGNYPEKYNWENDFHIIIQQNEMLLFSTIVLRSAKIIRIQIIGNIVVYCNRLRLNRKKILIFSILRFAIG